MIQFKINEAQTFQFNLEIDGKIKTVESVSFIIESGSGYDINVPARYNINTRLIECDIPVLEGLLTEGEKAVRLELVVDGKFYVPLQDKINIEMPIRMVSKMIQEPVKEDAVAVRVVSKKVSAPKPTKQVQEVVAPAEPVIEQVAPAEPVAMPVVKEIKIEPQQVIPDEPIKEAKPKPNAFSMWMSK